MQIKKLEELTPTELQQRIAALEPLCEWRRPILTKKNLFMQKQWGRLVVAEVKKTQKFSN